VSREGGRAPKCLEREGALKLPAVCVCVCVCVLVSREGGGPASLPYTIFRIFFYYLRGFSLNLREFDQASWVMGLRVKTKNSCTVEKTKRGTNSINVSNVSNVSHATSHIYVYI
jgi:hypothetical protein